MWDASDEALLAGMVAGHEHAATVFVRRFQRRVFGLALAILADEGRAADAAQEAFVRSWRHAATYDPRRGSVVTWLLSITRNIAIDHLRMERARPIGCVDVASLGLASEDRPSDEAAAQADQVQLVVTALSRLPDEQRRALVLAAIGGRSAREISELDDIPLGTAKTRIRTALLRVRVLLAEAEGVAHD